MTRIVQFVGGLGIFVFRFTQRASKNVANCNLYTLKFKVFNLVAV